MQTHCVFSQHVYLVLQCLKNTKLFDVSLRKRGQVWTPSHTIKSSHLHMASNCESFVWFRKYLDLEVWSTCGWGLNLPGVPIAPLEDKPVESALTGCISALAEYLVYTTVKARAIFWSVAWHSLGMGMAPECQWPPMDHKIQPGHPWLCHTQSLLCPLHTSENQSAFAEFGVWNWIYKEVIVTHCAIPHLWLFWVLGTTLILACTVRSSLWGPAWKVWILCSVSS